jgi:hypothetical protein
MQQVKHTDRSTRTYRFLGNCTRLGNPTTRPSAGSRQSAPALMKIVTRKTCCRTPDAAEEPVVEIKSREGHIHSPPSTYSRGTSRDCNFSPEPIESAKESIPHRQLSALAIPKHLQPSSPPYPSTPDYTVEIFEEPELFEPNFSAVALAQQQHEEIRRHYSTVPCSPAIKSDSVDEGLVPSLTHSRSSVDTELHWKLSKLSGLGDAEPQESNHFAVVLDWKMENMRRRHEQLERAQQELQDNNEEDSELAKMRKAGSPPMLGGDLVFPCSVSPKTTRCETDQLPRPRRANSDVEDSIDGGVAHR